MKARFDIMWLTILPIAHFFIYKSGSTSKQLGELS